MPKKTTQLPLKTTDLDSGDEIILVDTGDTTDSPEGSDKRVDAARFALSDGNLVRISGGGEISLAGNSLVVANSGTLQTDVEVAAAVAPKADTTYVDAELALKDDITDVDAKLALKDDITDVNAKLDLKQDALDATITGSGTLATDTGSLTLGTSVLTTGDKSGELAVMADIAGGEQSSAIYVPLSFNSDSSNNTSWFPYGFLKWNSGFLPDGWTIKLQAWTAGSGATSYPEVQLQTLGGSAVSSVITFTISSSQQVLDSNTFSLTDGVTYRVAKRTNGGSSTTFYLAALILEAP